MDSARHSSIGLSWSQLLRMSALWFGLQFFWTSQQLFVMPERLRHFVDIAYLGSYSSLLESCGAVVVLLTQFATGFISDHSHSRLGRRRPYILFGIACGCGAIVLFILAPSYWPLFAAYMLIQFFLNVGTLPFQSLLPDLVPESQHARAGSAMGFMDLAGKLLGLLSILAVTVFLHGDVQVGGNSMPAGYLSLLLPGYLIALLGSLLIVYFGADELRWARLGAQPLAQSEPAAQGGRMTRWRILPGVLVQYARQRGGLFGAILSSYLGVDLRARPDFVWLAASRGAVYLGYFTFQNYVNWYTIANLDRQGWLQSFGLSAETAQKYQNSVLAAMLVFFILGGIAGNLLCAPLARRFGKKWVITVGLGFAALFFVPLIFTSSVWTAIACGSILGIGWGAFLAADWAFACTLMPVERAGVFMGLWCLTNLMPQVLAPIISGPLRDLLFAYYQPALGELGAEAQAYRWVFATVIFWFVLGMLILRNVREERTAAAASA